MFEFKNMIRNRTSMPAFHYLHSSNSAIHSIIENQKTVGYADKSVQKYPWSKVISVVKIACHADLGDKF